MAEFDAAIKDIGDKIAGLTLVQAKSLADYMKDAYGIEPAAGGAIMMAPAARSIRGNCHFFQVAFTGGGPPALAVRPGGISAGIRRLSGRGTSVGWS